MPDNPILTMYYDRDAYTPPAVMTALFGSEHDGKDAEFTTFSRNGAMSMSEWYARFEGSDSVEQNEALIAALVAAADSGYARIQSDEGQYIVLNGDVPVEAMVASRAYENVYQIRGAADTDELDSHLSTRRIVLCYTADTEFLIDGEGRTLDVGMHTEGTGGVSDFLSSLGKYGHVDEDFLASVTEFVGEEAMQLADKPAYSR